MGAAGARRRERLRKARLYVVSGARRERGDLPAFLDAILGAGVDIVQLREKDAEAADLLHWGRHFRDAAQRHGALFILNDRPDVALAAGADGVHLGQDDLPVAIARGILGPDALIGLSTHSEEQFAGAAAEVDYLCAGPVHATPTKPGRAATGLGLVEAAANRSRDGLEPRPWFAIGGIDAATLPEIVAAGADRIVVVRAVGEAQRPPEAVLGLLAGLSRP
jgi:thiamine-phosphate pyrophosphorylase